MIHFSVIICKYLIQSNYILTIYFISPLGIMRFIFLFSNDQRDFLHIFY